MTAQRIPEAHKDATGALLAPVALLGVIDETPPGQITAVQAAFTPRLLLREKAFVRQARDVLNIGPIGSRNDWLSVTFGDGVLQVTTGCFSSSLADFESEVALKPEGIGKAEYQAAIELIKVRAKERGIS